VTLRFSNLVAELRLVSDDRCLSLPLSDTPSQRGSCVVEIEAVPTWAGADLEIRLRRSAVERDVLSNAGGEALAEESSTLALPLVSRVLDRCGSCWTLVKIAATTFLCSTESWDNRFNA